MEWWREMFETPAWQSVQLAWEEADAANDVAARVDRALGLARGARVLDVPCGTGRIATRLADRGFTVVGIDAIETFLAEARGAGVPVIRGDMRTAVVRPGVFDAAICLWGSFGYFDDAGNLAQAAAAAAALAPGGQFLVDTNVADSVLERFQPTASWTVGGVAVDEVRVYHEDTRRMETTWTFARGDEGEVRTTSVRLYSVAELTDLLATVGFASFQALDDDLEPFAPGADRLWLLAATPG
ncbi:MAG: class I SAM-dependent DNA methyltransferase [Actinomycetota bacterium]|jgi:SAM-dependent methyltransferase